jgi:hypothetical protein
MEQECVLDGTMSKENWQPSLQSALLEGTKVLHVPQQKATFLSWLP